jgi:hypothetical protein
MAQTKTKPGSSKQPTSSNKWEAVKFDSEKSDLDTFSLELGQADGAVIIEVYDDDFPVELGQLSAEELKTLTDCETAIDRNQDAFRETALALCIIRDQRLYREKFKTFEGYCRTRHGFGRKQGYRLAAAGQLLAEMGPIGDTALKNESAARALLKAPKAKRREALEKSVAESGGHPVTAAKISAAVKAVSDDNTEEDDDPAAEAVVVHPDFQAPTNQPSLATHREMAEWATKGYNIHSDSTRRKEVGEIFHRLMRELKRHAELESLEAA